MPEADATAPGVLMNAAALLGDKAPAFSTTKRRRRAR